MKKWLPVLAVALCACSSPSKSSVAPSESGGSVEIIALKYAEANQLAAILREMAGRQRRDDIVIADPRTNSLVVKTTSEAELARIREVIAKLDVQVK